MTTKHPSISAFFPCYNDQNTIGKMVDDTTRVLSKVTKKYEVIVVDDGSRDDSREILKKIARKNKKLKLIFHEQNKGYGGALKSGFAASSHDLVFYTDGDGQYDPGELKHLLSLMTDDVDFVNGIKMGRKDSWERVFFGNMHKFITRWLFWLPIYDTDCDFRLIRKKILAKIKLKSDSGSICPELVKKTQRAGARFREVSVHHYERKHGQSQFFKIDKIVKTYWDLLSLWFQLMVVEPLLKR